MKTELFDYELPEELIAQKPADVRSESRLLVLDRAAGKLTDSRFSNLVDYIEPGDCLVLNDTKVLPARFFAHRHTGAALEGLFLARKDAPGVWQIMLKGARKVRLGESFDLVDRQDRNYCKAELLEKQDEGTCLIRVESTESPQTILEAIGFPPLPPYIKRDHDPAQALKDQDRYQTVYARRPGAVAAPTAGLHFTEELIGQLKTRGVRFACVTLHVGAGTFKPVTVENLEDHEIHEEWYQVDQANADIINATRAGGGRIVAVGTTATRVLETSVAPPPSGVIPAEGGWATAAGQGTTRLFIMPGYEFKAVDVMITNFHLPRSTLLALVAAFAGLEPMLTAYRHAVQHRYRFYSYGDAMLIL
jgi:S-adenosylmethionine:tRNA ribosyltransferase-isomerase